MKHTFFTKRALTVVLAICMILSGAMFAIPATALDGDTAKYVEGYMPQYTPQTYYVNENTISERIYMPGDTIVFQASSASPDLVGFYLSFAGDDTDNTADVATVLADYNATAHQSITVGGRPIFMRYKGQGPAESGSNKRCNTYVTTCYETMYLVNLKFSASAGNGLALGDELNRLNNPAQIAIYPSPTEYTFQLTDYLNDPVVEGYYFVGWRPVADGGSFIRQTSNPNEIQVYFINNTQYTSEFYPAKEGNIEAVFEYGCTVTLQANGGTIEGGDCQIYEVACGNENHDHGEKNFDLFEHIPVLEGKSFAGWYTDTEYTRKITELSELGLNCAYQNDRERTLYAKWEDPHSITVENDGNGDGSASAYSAAEGTEITLYTAPNEGYRLKEWQVISGDITITDNTFVMPCDNVTVKAIYEPDSIAQPPASDYRVSVLSSANGLVTADRSTATTGDTVTLTVTPKDGYRLKQIQILDGLGQDLCHEIGLTVSDNTFSMPNMNVRIQAIFEKITGDGTADALNEQDGVVEFSKPVPEDCTLDIRQMPLPDGYTPADGEASVLYDITVLRNNTPYPIKDNSITVTITLPDKFVGFEYYRVSYLNDSNELVETQDATVSGNTLQFTTGHLSGYLIEAGNHTSHEHSYDADWKYDGSGHWHECSCGDISDTTAHTFGDWTVTKAATATENGSRERSCTVCGYTETDAVEKAEAPQTTGTESKEAKPQSDPIVWIVLSVVLAVGLVGIFLFLRKRSASK